MPLYPWILIVHFLKSIYSYHSTILSQQCLYSPPISLTPFRIQFHRMHLIVMSLQFPLIQSTSSALAFMTFVFLNCTGQLLCWVSLNFGLSYGSAWLDSSYAFWAGIPLKWGYHVSKHRMWVSSQCWQQKPSSLV